MRRKFFIFGMILCLAFAVAIVGCAKQEEASKEEAPMKETPVASSSAEPTDGGTIVFGRGGDSVGLDPAYETDGNSFMVCDNLYEQLAAYKDETTDIEPGLAKSWEISDDGKTYTFELREGVTFHDGTPYVPGMLMSDDIATRCPGLANDAARLTIPARKTTTPSLLAQSDDPPRIRTAG